ncbi:Uncharacterised protein [Vibrio cholerae]|nr:Uncharacterised protein [Vibrio cholerae]
MSIKKVAACSVSVKAFLAFPLRSITRVLRMALSLLSRAVG